jgi:hypothetical protein
MNRQIGGLPPAPDIENIHEASALAAGGRRVDPDFVKGTEKTRRPYPSANRTEYEDSYFWLRRGVTYTLSIASPRWERCCIQWAKRTHVASSEPRECCPAS